jgi:hypothetical protein
MKAIIPRAQYEAYEAVILSGQVDQKFVPILLASDLEFASWYRSRVGNWNEDMGDFGLWEITGPFAAVGSGGDADGDGTPQQEDALS